jgi:hypothetical protein
LHRRPGRLEQPVAALAVLPPLKAMISLGSTGTMMPSASMSSRTVMKMKMKAGRDG